METNGPPSEFKNVDLVAALGATDAVSAQCFTI
jgi:hypothetical protein